MRNEYYRDTRTGLTLYAQEVGDRAAPTIAGSAVAGDGTLYQFTALDDDTDYEVFEQAGASPGTSDEAIAVIGKELASASDVAAATGQGDYSITINFIDGASVAVSNVKVTVVGTSRVAYSDASGVAVINVNPDNYTLRYTTPFGYDTLSDESVSVSGDTVINKTVNNTTLTPSTDPALCAMVFSFVKVDGSLPDNITIKARIAERNSVANKLVTTETVTATTDATGQATIELIRSDQFSAGTGEYEIEAYYTDSNRPVMKTRTTVPNAASYNFAQIFVS